MAKINDGTLKDWKNGDKLTSDLYEADREILRIAINDTDAKTDANTTTTSDHTKRITDLEYNVTGTVVPMTFKELGMQNLTFDDIKLGYVDKAIEKAWKPSLDTLTRGIVEETTATEGQTVVNTTNSYTVGDGQITVDIDGVPQATSSYTETSTTSITLSEPLVAGQKVRVTIGKVQPSADSRFSSMGTEIDGLTTQMADIAYNVKTLGAKGDGVTDDTAKIQTVLNTCRDAGGGRVYIPKGTYKISNTLTVYANTVLYGEGIFEASSVTTDAFVVNGSNTSGSEGKNIRFENITIKNAQRFGIQIYGAGYTYKPSKITFENVKTENCVAGGIYVNSATYIRFSKCFNDGGFRHIGIESPKPATTTTTLTDTERYSKYIIIEHCTSINTTQFSYQAFYTDFISVIGCHADGTLTTGGDKSCITLDRCNNATVTGNVVRNSPGSVIFVTGCENVTVEGNTIYAPTSSLYGIQVFYNIETTEDVVIKENKNITVSGNSVRGCSIGIILNGAKTTAIVGNVCTGQGSSNGIYIMGETRTGDSVAMVTDQITLVGNISDKNIAISATGVTSPTTFIGNRVSNITGLVSTDIVLDNTQVRFGKKDLTYSGLFKRSELPNDVWLAQYELSTSETFHKGMIEKYQFGNYVLSDSTGDAKITFNVGKGDGDNGGIELLKAGKGIIFKSPDGLTKKKLTIDNTGVAVWTTIP